jgi:transposase
VINQLKSQLHLWLDQTPGDLLRGKAVTSLTTVLEAAQLGSCVRQAFEDMVAEIVHLNHRVRQLDTTIKDLVGPLAPTLLQITGISYNSAAVLVAEIGDVTRFATSAKLARYTGCAKWLTRYNTKRRHSWCRYQSPITYETNYTATLPAAE